jgi:hypothetical protein
MTASEFDEQLRYLLRRRPFLPFEIELLDGNRLWIDQAQALGFNNGAGSFIGPDQELYFFNYTTVRRIGETPKEATT